MKKKILLASSAVVLTVMSIFAFTAKSVDKPVAKVATEQCPPECCNGTGGNCDTQHCDKDAKECCEKKQSQLK